jgi:hypothetical protein
MKKTLHLIAAYISLFLIGNASAQSSSDKKFDTNYLEICVQKQVQAHQNLKAISQDHFRSYCECTSKKILNSLSSEQLDELNKRKSLSNSFPKWFKSVEEASSKACLKLNTGTQV